MTHSAYIISALRTAVAPKGGAFANVPIQDLAAPVIRGCLDTRRIKPSDVDELILSNAVGGGGNPARLAALAAGLPESVGGLSIDRQCAGGLDALLLAEALVKSGNAKIVIAGGAESASLRPKRFKKNAGDGSFTEYERPAFTGLSQDPEMHQAAADLAQELGISRQSQDEFAIQSHAKALVTEFTNEIVPLQGLKRDAFTRKLTQNLCLRAKPIQGTLTSANTAVDADAAAFFVVVSEEIAKNFPNAVKIVAGSQTASTPHMPAKGADAAVRRVLSKAKLQFSDFCAVELMEAYAAQAMATINQFKIPKDVLNLGGGALARGHPIGASGAILAVRLFHQLQSQNGQGLAAIAAAGGLGSAVILSR